MRRDTAKIREMRGRRNGRRGGMKSHTFGGLVPVTWVHPSVLVLGGTADQDGVVRMGLNVLL